MPDYFAELLAAQKEAEAAFGTSFTLADNFTNTFRGVFSHLDGGDVIEMGAMDMDVAAQCECHKAQFVTVGLMPVVGMVARFPEGNYRIIRVNRRENSLELLLKQLFL